MNWTILGVIGKGFFGGYSEKGHSKDMSARKRWFELIFGFRMRFSITCLNISGGNEQALW